jgi:hypothetical protein
MKEIAKETMATLMKERSVSEEKVAPVRKMITARPAHRQSLRAIPSSCRSVSTNPAERKLSAERIL